MPDNDISAAARALGARRRLVVGQCAYCARPFVGTTDRKWCSRSCRTLAYRARRKAAGRPLIRKRRPPLPAPGTES